MSLQKNETLARWTLLDTFCLHFWAWLLLYSVITPKSEDKYVQNCSTRQSFIFPKWHSYKIGTLARASKYYYFLWVMSSFTLFWDYLSFPNRFVPCEIELILNLKSCHKSIFHCETKVCFYKIASDGHRLAVILVHSSLTQNVILIHKTRVIFWRKKYDQKNKVPQKSRPCCNRS